MVQAKFSLDDPHLVLLERCKVYGFKDKSAMVRAALDILLADLERKRLQESAELYAGLYETDEALQELTDAAVEAWPS